MLILGITVTVVTAIIIIMILIVGQGVVSTVDDINTTINPPEQPTLSVCEYNTGVIGLNSLNTTSRGIPSFASGVPHNDWSGTAEIGLTASNEMHFISVDHNSKIRQSGTVNGIYLETGDDYNSSSLTGFTVSVWRKDGSTYDKIGETANIVSSLKASAGIRTITFADITGVKEGDYLGYSFTGTGSPTLGIVDSFGEASGVSTYYLDGSSPSATNMDWEAQSSLVDWADMKIMMNSPSIVFLGQSITAGSNFHSPYIHSSGADSPEDTLSYKVGESLGVSVQNWGNANSFPNPSKVSDGVAVMPDIIGLIQPKVLVISYGHNDAIALTDITDFETDLQNIVDTAQANQITPVLQQIYLKDSFVLSYPYNNVIKSIADSEGITVINVDPVIAQQSATQTNCNLPDFKSGYTSDGSHLTEIAHTAVASFLIDPTDPLIQKITYPLPQETEEINEITSQTIVILSVVMIAVFAVKAWQSMT